MVGGASSSGPGGNKTAPARGGSDYWILKSDSQGNKLWDESFGGSANEGLFAIQPAENGSYLVGGNSISEANGNRSAASFGGSDIWIIRFFPREVPAGTPVVLVNGLFSPDNSFEIFKTRSVQVTLETSFLNGATRYTLDGSAPGANSTLYTAPFEVSQNGTIRALAFSSGGGQSILAEPVLITLPDAPAISNQPQNQTVLQGATATFRVVAPNGADYQWRYNGSDLGNNERVNGATTDTLTISNVQLSDAGNYSVAVENEFGSVISSEAVLSVATLPIVTVQPINRTVTVGGTAAFSVSATGTPPLSYRWQKNGSILSPLPNLSGTSSATLTISNVRSADAGTYRVEVINAFGSTFSSDATLAVVEPNRPPSFIKGPNVAVPEDSGAKIVEGWAKNISAGHASESGQQLVFLVATDNAALFSATPAINASGTLTFTPAADAFGKATATVTLKDNGGTAGGGQDASAAQTFLITVTPVNDPPSFIKGADQFILEDAGPQIVQSWATALTVGPSNETGQKLSFTVTADNKVLFAKPPAISPTGTLTYTPPKDANGSSTVSVIAKDSGGTAAGGLNASAAQTFTITVAAVNDPPSFTKGPNVTALEDSGAKAVEGWAQKIVAGPADESAQTVAINVSHDSPALFSVPPSLSPTGALNFTPAANASGKAIITVSLSDNGGTAQGGQNTSAPQTFLITVAPVNDPPSFTKGPDQAILEDAGPQTVPSWAAALSLGPENEASQKLSFIVTTDNKALFARPPAVAPNGTLTYTPAKDANGSATMSVSAKDNGGTAAGGSNASAAQTFTITVAAVNDPPSFTKGPNVTVLSDSGLKIIENWAKKILAGPADESAQTIAINVSHDNPALFSAPPSLSSSGALSFTPAANATGKAAVAVSLRDNGGTAQGGKDVSAVQTFVITVKPNKLKNGASVSSSSSANLPAEVLPGYTLEPDDSLPADKAELGMTPTVLQLVHVDGEFRILLHTAEGRKYVLESRDSLTEGDWNEVSSLAGDGVIYEMPDPEPAAAQRFYRVRIE